MINKKLKNIKKQEINDIRTGIAKTQKKLGKRVGKTTKIICQDTKNIG